MPIARIFACTLVAAGALLAGSSPVTAQSLPMAFEAASRHKAHHDGFTAQGPGYRLLLSPREAAFQLAPLSPSPNRAQRQGTSSDRVTMRLVGASDTAHAVQPASPTGYSNYFLGQDRRRWRTQVPLYNQVEYAQVYSGIDLVYYGDQRRLEYDFRVRPGADPKRIRLQFQGAQSVRIAPNGDLVVRLQQTEVRWHRPETYQMIAGKKRPIASAFVRNRRGQIGFQVARYDPSRPLTIDPQLIYSYKVPGSEINGMATDSAGATYLTGTVIDYVAGRANHLSFPVTSSAFQTTPHFTFIAKLNAAGTALLYATYLGGSLYDQANAIAVDGLGNAYITGSAQSTDFPITPGAFQTVNNASTEVVDLGFNGTGFVAKLSPNGDRLLYSTFLGGHTSAGSADTGRQIAVDAQGNAYIAGVANSADFPVTPGAFQTTAHSVNVPGTAFITKLNPTGTALVYSTFLAGSRGSQCNGLALGSAGDVYVTGFTSASDFPVTSTAFQKTSHNPDGGMTAFITHLNATGSGLLYSTYLGGSQHDYGASIAVDSSGAAYVTGDTFSSDFPFTPGAFQAPRETSGGAFVAKLDPTGSRLIYAAGLRGSDAGVIAVDRAGCAYVTGIAPADFPGVPPGIRLFPTTVGAAYRNLPGTSFGAYLTKLNPAGTALLYSTYLPDLDSGSGLSVDAQGVATVIGSQYVTRLFTHPIFPDFNADNHTDLLIRNQATGAIGTWFMNGAKVQGGVPFSQTPPATYSLVGAGDFTGDGSTTLVFQDRVDNRVVFWYTAADNTTRIVGGDYVYPTPEPGWKLVGVADFNQDGRSDLLFQNQKTEQMAIWKMNGPFYQGGNSLKPPSGGGWKAVGAGDFDQDGMPDILFQNATTGELRLALMQGTKLRTVEALAAVPAAGWKVVGIGDYNGDGWPDLLFQNADTSLAAVWYLKSMSYSGGSTLSLIMPAGWQIAGPR